MGFPITVMDFPTTVIMDLAIRVTGFPITATPPPPPPESGGDGGGGVDVFGGLGGQQTACSYMGTPKDYVAKHYGPPPLDPEEVQRVEQKAQDEAFLLRFKELGGKFLTTPPKYRSPPR